MIGDDQRISNMKKRVESRLGKLESKNVSDDQDRILVIWSDDDKPELQPGDVRVWFGDDDQVHSEVIREKKN